MHGEKELQGGRRQGKKMALLAVSDEL